MRGKNSILNVTTIVLIQILNFIYSLIGKKLLLDNFPIVLVGVSELFTTFFRTLALIDAGFGTLFVYNLYKPISDDNKEEIAKIVFMFQKIFTLISVVIFTLSILFMPFIDVVFNIDYDNMLIVYLIYLIQLFSLCSKYLLLYKSYIMRANQKTYISNTFLLILDFITFILKYFATTLFNNYVLYITILSAYPVLIQLCDYLWISKKYPYLNIRKKISFKQIKEHGIFEQCKNYLYKTFYDLIFYITDHFIISIFMVTSIIAYVSNYTMIISTASYFLVTITTSFQSIMADYLNKEKNIDGFYSMYNVVNLCVIIFTSFMISGFMTMLDDFIGIWLGSNFILENNIVFVLVLTLLLDSAFRTVENVYIINGYILMEKAPLVISALVNLFFSIILIRPYGVFGVYFGTLLGKIVFWIGKTYYVSKYIFNPYKREFILKQCKNIMFVFITSLFTAYFCKILVPSVETVVQFCWKAVFCICITGIINLFYFGKTKEFKALWKNLFRVLSNWHG